jgi:hypothetical protein
LSTVPLEQIFNNYFDVLSHRRSRRHSGAYKPVGAFKDWTPKHEPEPLSKAEKALLCYAGCGANGLISNDLPHAPGVSLLSGHTYATPDNAGVGAILFVDDEGKWLYKPKPCHRMWRVEKPADLQEVVDSFDEERIQLSDEGFVRSSMDSAFFTTKDLPFHQNRPGSITFMPIAQPANSFLKIMAVCMAERADTLMVDEKGEPAGIGKWADKLNLKRPLPVIDTEKNFAVWGFIEAAEMNTNIMLAAESMGLGTSPQGLFNAMVPFGGTPLSRGFGFRYATDKNGIPYPVGIDGVYESLCPPYMTPFEIADWIINERYREFGALNEQTPAAVKDQVAQVRSFDGAYTDDHVQCLADLCQWIWDRYGRIPISQDPVVTAYVVSVHHLDVDMYKHFYKEGHLTERILEHDAIWHG